MARVTVSEVKTILGTTSLTDDAITVFIDMANSLVNDKIVNSGYSEDKLKLIELNLSAHFCSMQGNTVKRNKIGDAEQEYKVSTLEGLESTLYGQTALLFDDKNYLTGSEKTLVSIAVY